MVTGCVLFEVRTEFLTIIYMNFGFKGLRFVMDFAVAEYPTAKCVVICKPTLRIGYLYYWTGDANECFPVQERLTLVFISKNIIFCLSFIDKN
jgi:hypothetical protein